MTSALLLAQSKARFNSPRGPLTVEDLFDLPLTGPFSLDSISTIVLAEQDAQPRKSLVSISTKPANKIADAKVEVLTAIIEFKQTQLEAKEKQAINKQRKAKLMDQLANIEKGDIEKMSKEDVLKELASLD